MNDFGMGAVARLAMLGLLAIPLAIWKLIDIVIWVLSRLEWKS